MPGVWKTVRVFISSTFRDMHAERDHLIKVTFPSLRERLLPYRVELYDIDLRWGITEDEAKNEQVIGLCLEQVDLCRPFFLAFIGHRYGWVPGQVPQETQQRFPFVKEFPGVSVTELELRHGAMLDPTGMRTLVLVRKEEAVTSIPEATRKRDFQESDPRLQQKLAALKQELEVGPYPVQPYSAGWDPNRYDRVNRTEGKLAHLDDFGQQVENWLWEAIRKELQLPDTPDTVGPLDAEADLHERFMEMRTRIYIGRDDLYRRLQDFALACGEFPLLLTGESGLGKSAALSRFVRDFRKEHADVFVLPHFVGASPRTTSLAGMLQRLTQELQRKFNLTLPKAESPDEIIRTFTVALISLPESARVVLVFDALNQIDSDSRADSLAWLPEKLPPYVRVLCSSATGPQKTPRVLTAFGERVYANVPLRALSDDERRAIIKTVPKLVAKTLDDNQIDALLSNPATRNPLFLMITLEELRGYGSFENLNKLIAKLPKDGDALTKLFETVFSRLEKEFSKGLVEQTLSLLVCARRGLSEPELVELTRNLGGASDELYPLLRQLEPYLHRRDGRYDFYHMSIRRAVEVYYLKWEEEEDQHDPWLRWNPERKPPASEPTEQERETRHRLIDSFETDRLGARAIDELPWQLAQLCSWQRLFDLLANLAFFDAAWRADELEVRMAWSLVKTVGGLEPIEAYGAVLAKPAGREGNAIWRIATYMQTSGQEAAVHSLWSVFIEHFRNTGDEGDLAGCLGNQALILKHSGDLDGAMRLSKEQEAICRRRDDQAGLRYCLANQALILADRGDLKEAMRLHKEVELICRHRNDLDSLGTCLGNQALILHSTGDWDGAMRLLKEEEAICRQRNDPANLGRNLGNQGAILINAGDANGAMRMLKENEAICRRFNNPAGLANCLVNQGSLLAGKQSRPADGLALAEEALRLATQHGLLAQARGIGQIVEYVRKKINDAPLSMELLKEDEQIHRRGGDRIALAKCLGQQGDIHLEHGEFDLAITEFDEAIRLNPDDSDPAQKNWCTKRADAHRKQGNDGPAQACELYNQAINCARKGDYPAAITCYQNAMQADPDFAWAPNNLAWLLATCPDETVRNGKAAVAFATRACELAGWKCWSFLDTLAASYAEAAEAGEAARWAEKAVQIAPEEKKAESQAALERYRAKLVSG